MELSAEEKQRVYAGILKKYQAVANSPTGLFRYPIGREGLDRLGYEPELLAQIPGFR